MVSVPTVVAVTSMLGYADFVDIGIAGANIAAVGERCFPLRNAAF